MSRLIYISCAPAFHEHELEEVKSLCAFLQQSGCVLTYSLSAGSGEGAIEEAAAFVAVIGEGYSLSSHLNGELHLARALNGAHHSPRLFGLRVGDWGVPHCSQGIELEWLDDANRQLLLTDLLGRS